MSVLTQKDKSMLLKLARSTIEAELMAGAEIQLPQNPSEALKEKRGCFVTLHENGVLRGCIGTIEPLKPLSLCVREHAINSAFRDPRFPPLSQKELSAIEIEISVLTVPRPIIFTDGEDLKKKLKPRIHGVILSRGWQSATFLPQVWEQLPDVEAFLEHLCEKGGMKRSCWQSPETTVKVYEVEYFSESDL
jgi:AmmeMemoRadiSam system protein A